MNISMKISIGDTYLDARPPRHEWRVIETHRGERFTLERVDKQSVLRFVDHDGLCDPRRYVRKA
jgi:hypothetical protein